MSEIAVTDVRVGLIARYADDFRAAAITPSLALLFCAVVCAFASVEFEAAALVTIVGSRANSFAAAGASTRSAGGIIRVASSTRTLRPAVRMMMHASVHDRKERGLYWW